MNKIFDVVCYQIATRFAVVVLGFVYITSGLVMPQHATKKLQSALKMFEEELN